MFKTNLICFILSLSIYTKAQNLVFNPSFEQHTNCPTTYSQINYCNSWNNGSAQSTCDYYSADGCSTNFSPPLIHYLSYLTLYQQPLSGKSFAGFIPYIFGGNLREFLQGTFITPLTVGQLYYIEFYVNASSQQKYTIHDIFALISDTVGLVDQNNVQNYSPQILPASNVIYKDTTRWMRINGYYTSQGGENYITIGNFTPEGHE